MFLHKEVNGSLLNIIFSLMNCATRWRIYYHTIITKASQFFTATDIRIAGGWEHGLKSHIRLGNT
jgi:hypothetical protein